MKRVLCVQDTEMFPPGQVHQYKQVALLTVPRGISLGRDKTSRCKKIICCFFAQIVSSGPHTPTEESLRSSLRNWPQELETFTRDSDYKNLIGF